MSSVGTSAKVSIRNITKLKECLSTREFRPDDALVQGLDAKPNSCSLPRKTDRVIVPEPHLGALAHNFLDAIEGLQPKPDEAIGAASHVGYQENGEYWGARQALNYVRQQSNSR